MRLQLCSMPWTFLVFATLVVPRTPAAYTHIIVPNTVEAGVKMEQRGGKVSGKTISSRVADVYECERRKFRRAQYALSLRWLTSRVPSQHHIRPLRTEDYECCVWPLILLTPIIEKPFRCGGRRRTFRNLMPTQGVLSFMNTPLPFFAARCPVYELSRFNCIQ